MPGKIKTLICLLLTLCLLSSCAAVPVDSLIGREESTAYPVLPETTPQSLPDQSPEAYSMELTHKSGKSVLIEDPDAARLLLLAGVDQSRRTQDPGCDFAHSVKVMDGQGTELVTFEIAGDGDAYGRDPDGQVFFLPQYCQSVLEAALWPEYLSLWQSDWMWGGDPDVTGALEVRLPYFLNCFTAQQFGYADAYFSTYRLYEVKKGKYSATLYLLAVRKAFRIEGERFNEVYLDAVPVRLTLDQSVSGAWRLSSVKIADFSGGVKKDAVRSLFSYDLTNSAMEDLKDTSAMEEQLDLEVRSFMLLHGLSGLTWEP